MLSSIKLVISLMSRKQKIKLIVLQFFVVVMALIEVLSLALLGPFIAVIGNVSLIETNQLLQNAYIAGGFESVNDFLFAFGLVVVMFLTISALISVFTVWKLSKFAAAVGSEFGDVLYQYYLRKDYLFHVTVGSAHLTKQIATEASRVTDHILQPMVQINARIMVVLLISVAIFIYNPVISVLGLFIFTLIYIAMYYLVRRKLYDNGKDISSASKERFQLMEDGFSSIKDIHILNCDKKFSRNFIFSGNKLAEAYGTSNGLYNVPRYLMEFIIYSSMIGLILVLLNSKSGDMSSILPTLAIFGIAALKILPSFQQIYSNAAQIKANSSALLSLKGDLISARININLGHKSLCLDSRGNGGLELRSVSFKYPNTASLALNDISLSIPIKSKVAFVGKSGSGKSTIVDMLLGLIKPDAGGIYLNKFHVDKEYIKEWQSKLGSVPQSVYLLDDNIDKNIAFGQEDIDSEKLGRAIEKANLKDWISSLKDGIHSKLGEGGVQVSGGQRQRIGIARAIYSDPEFLFFDEATSALDARSEKYIMQSIDALSKNCTVIIVAHRIQTIKSCDLIFIVDSGRVVAQGSYDDLLSNNIYFNEMSQLSER